MHREIQEHLEEVLAGRVSAQHEQHLAQCQECSEQVTVLRQQARVFAELKAPPGVEPRAGFYARVMERIEAEGPVSIWNLFIESAFGRRIAVASLALAVLMGVYLVTLESGADQPLDQAIMAAQPAPQQGSSEGRVTGEDGPAQVLTSSGSNPSLEPASDDAVLVNLVTYQDQ
jgi:anti-sigma factor RsiW